MLRSGKEETKQVGRRSMACLLLDIAFLPLELLFILAGLAMLKSVRRRRKIKS